MSETETLTEQEVRDAGLSPEPSEAQQIDESYVESDAHYWKQTKLEPYSARRQTAAMCLGLRFTSLSKEEMLSGLTTGGYPDAMQDAIIILYLCFPRGKVDKASGMTSSIEESYAACSPNQREAVRRRMLIWAEEQGIEMCSPTLTEAANLMVKILKEDILNRFRPAKPSGSAPPGND